MGAGYENKLYIVKDLANKSRTVGFPICYMFVHKASKL